VTSSPILLSPAAPECDRNHATQKLTFASLWKFPPPP
jgi:hypothetical protein